MRTPILTALAAALTLGAVAAPAQVAPRYDDRDRRDDQRDDQRGPDRRDYDRRDARQDRRDDRRDARQDRRDWRQYRNYDYNRFEPGQRAYYAETYYRNDPSYRPFRLGRNDRVYRGRDNRYYCRRSDGTTGLVVGAAVGSLFGNAVAGGGSRLLGTILGGNGGALLGQSIDRGQVSCR